MAISPSSTVPALLMFLLLFGAAAQAGHLPEESKAYVAPRAASRPVQAYPFVHLDGCTGACNFVIIDGKSIPISFSSDSDPAALKLLWGLKLEIFFPNTSARLRPPRLYVVGQLYDGISRDPIGDDYHEFLLTRWYLAAPFVEDKRYSEEMRETYMVYSEEELPPRLRGLKPTLRTKLWLSDFERIDGMKIDLNRLVRTEAPAGRGK